MNKGTIFRLLFLGYFLLLSNVNIYSQIWCSLSLTIDKTVGANLFYFENSNNFYVGFSYQSNGQKNTIVRERKKTYGLTPIEEGDFYRLIDLGYSRKLLAERS